MGKYFSLIYSGEVHEETENLEDKVISSKEFSELLDAYSILECAKEDVRLYMEKTKKECAELAKKAEEAGFSRGLIEFNKQILHCSERLKRLEHDLQKACLPLVLKAAQKIVGRELKTHPTTIVDIVRQALKSAINNYHIHIFVSKQDLEILSEEKNELRTMLEHAQVFKIEEREDVTPGGCIIVTEAGIINASLENQWRALASAFAQFKL